MMFLLILKKGCLTTVALGFDGGSDDLFSRTGLPNFGLNFFNWQGLLAVSLDGEAWRSPRACLGRLGPVYQGRVANQL